MPNRYLRQDYLESEAVSSLSMSAEVLWTRLIVIVDDFGRHEASPALLRPKLFPLRLNDVREANLVRWIAECEKANLIRLYSVGQKRFVQMMKWEKGRAKKSKCPDPPKEILECCYLGSDGDCMPPPTSVDACEQMFADENISPDSDTDTDSDNSLSLSAGARDDESSSEIPPVTLERAISRGGEMAISEEIVTSWWHDRDALGWRRKQQPITRWTSDLRKFAASWGRNEQKSKSNGTHQHSTTRGSGTHGTCNEGKTSQYGGIK